LLGSRLCAALVVIVIGGSVGAAWAQEDLTHGRTPAQLYASDCRGCHHDARSFARTDVGQLAAFLRVHYTASKESAAAIARYLSSLTPATRSVRHRPVSHPAPASGKPAAALEEKKGLQAKTAAKPAAPSEEKKELQEQGSTAATAKTSEASAPKPAEPVKDEKSTAAAPKETPAAGAKETPAAAPDSKPASP
jgi:hypothetical protein